MNILSDTTSAFERIYFNLQKEKTVKQKISQAVSMSSFIINLSKRRMKLSDPILTQMEIDLLFIRNNYGEKIFTAVKKYIEK